LVRKWKPKSEGLNSVLFVIKSNTFYSLKKLSESMKIFKNNIYNQMKGIVIIIIIREEDSMRERNNKERESK
jgi:hypothetical protein